MYWELSEPDQQNDAISSASKYLQPATTAGKTLTGHWLKGDFIIYEADAA